MLKINGKQEMQNGIASGGRCYVNNKSKVGQNKCKNKIPK